MKRNLKIFFCWLSFTFIPMLVFANRPNHRDCILLLEAARYGDLRLKEFIDAPAQSAEMKGVNVHELADYLVHSPFPHIVRYVYETKILRRLGFLLEADASKLDPLGELGWYIRDQEPKSFDFESAVDDLKNSVIRAHAEFSDGLESLRFLRNAQFASQTRRLPLLTYIESESENAFKESQNRQRRFALALYYAVAQNEDRGISPKEFRILSSIWK